MLQQIVAVGVRLFAIWLLFNVLVRILTGVPYQFSEGATWETWTFIGALLAHVLVSVILWKFPLAVAKRIVPWGSAPTPTEGFHAREFERVAISLMGLFLLTQALSDAMHWGAYLVWLNQAYPERLVLNIEQIAGLLTLALELVIAFWLLLGGSGVAKLLHRTRSFGTGTDVV